MPEPSFCAINGNLERYNFDAMGFPSGFNTNTFIPVGNTSYALQFKNVEVFAVIPVAIESARKFQIQIRQSRQVVFELTLKPIGGEPKALNQRYYNVIQAQIQSFRILMPDEQVLAEKKI